MGRGLVPMLLAAVAFAGLGHLLLEALSGLPTTELRRERDLDETLRKLLEFAREVDEVLEDVQSGLRLDYAVQRVEKSAEELSPLYLQNLHLEEPGPTLHGRVARNLVRHIRDYGAAPELIQRLEKELAKYFTKSSNS